MNSEKHMSTMEHPPVVLYVEDDPQSRTLMKMLISGRMKIPSLTLFENSERFLERVEALDPKPTLIFLDIHMKPYTGFQMLEMLRSLEWAKKVPIVALTASVMHEEVQLLRTVGFDGCLAKPLEMASFPDAVRRILQGESIWRIVTA
jgi:CheY-like chemotaxis protein